MRMRNVGNIYKAYVLHLLRLHLTQNQALLITRLGDLQIVQRCDVHGEKVSVSRLVESEVFEKAKIMRRSPE